MTLNSTRSIVETGAINPYANNTVSTPPMSVIASRIPNLICPPVAVESMQYSLRTDPVGFWNQIARTRSLLPVPDIRVKTAAVVVYKPVFRVGIPPWVNRSFDLPDNQDAALNWLRYRIVTTGIYFAGGRNHFLGMVHPGIAGNFNGYGATPGEVLLARMESGNGPNLWDSPYGGRTLAHEMSHNYGEKHVDQTKGGECGGSVPANPNDAYPFRCRDRPGFRQSGRLHLWLGSAIGLDY